MSLKLIEMYRSLQGESTFAGLPFAFVRLAGCDLRCRWCDSEFTFTGGKLHSIDAIVEAVRAMGTSYVLVTGGEPMLQKETPALCKALLEEGWTVLIETGGHRRLDALDDRVIKIVDVKCPGSGEVERNHWENLDQLRDGDELKFVLADRDDYAWAVRQVRDRALDRRSPVLFSPVHGTLGPGEMARWVLEDCLPVRVQLQLHKILWPGAEKGV